MELFNFQKKAIKQLLKNMFIKNENKIIFKAPTGSGKTIIMSYFIDVINEIKLYGISSPFLSN